MTIDVKRGGSPLILGLPHTGTDVPDEVLQNLNAKGRALADTDWHIDRLYAGLMPDATTVRTATHRYVVDANRGPDDGDLYPGQNSTGLVPLTDFDGNPIWVTPPEAEEIEQRRALWHAPYHQAMAAEIERVKTLHGFAILYDCHSIRSEIPFLFDGVLPDFNIGTNSGASCDAAIERLVAGFCQDASGYSTVLNARFKGGWTTRHYGDPPNGVHAIQMELAQSTYMDEAPPWTWRDGKARQLRPILNDILTALTEWRPA